MMHLPHLIEDLAFILMTAAVVTLLFKKLKQPVVLGYLSAGLLLGPKFSLFPNIQDTASISIWAEIGVIFMLFGLGLEFSFKKLTQVGKSASVTASVEIVFMLGIGYLVGILMGWSKMDSLFLGGMISISSTTIIVRAFEELGLKGKSFVALVFGVLIVEDLIAILLLVLLSSVAATQSLSGSELAISSLKLGFFLVLWFLLGIYLLPVFFRKIRDLLSDETTLVVSLGLCLMMVYIATEVGFSPALGAFVMGSLLAETKEGHRIERLLLPVKDLFSAVFFVSVGMLIDPDVLVQYWGVILILTAITIAGKLFSTTLGSLLSGRNLKHSVQAGMSVAQIGEFSFIIATLGITLKVTSDFLYPIAVAVSAITTFITPYLIKSSDGFYGWLNGRIPQSMRDSLNRPENSQLSKRNDDIQTLILKEYGMRFALNAVIIVAISRIPFQKIGAGLDGEITATLFGCAIAVLLSLPFLWAVFFGGNARIQKFAGLKIATAIVRALLGFVLLGVLVSRFVLLLTPMGLATYLISLAIILFSKKVSEPIYSQIESRFLTNLTEKELSEAHSKLPTLAPWNAILSETRVSPDSSLVAKALFDSKLKERFGVTVAMIERGTKRILAPKRTDLLLPHDRVFLIGTDEQIAEARKILESGSTGEPEPISDAFGLASMVLGAEDPFVHKTIRDCGIREAMSGLIVGLERKGVRYLSPDSSMELMPEDLLWIVGDLKALPK